jgi:hypothetical protein
VLQVAEAVWALSVLVWALSVLFRNRQKLILRFQWVLVPVLVSVLVSVLVPVPG